MSSLDRGRSWVWALVSVLAVLLLVGSAYLAHHEVVGSRGAPPVSAPLSQALDVIAVTTPGPSYELLADDGLAGHVVALSSAGQPLCPPVGLCPPAPPLASFVVFDAASGAILDRTPLDAAAGESKLLLVDDLSHQAYAVAPQSISVFSTQTGAALGSRPLFPAIAWQSETGGAFDPADHSLILAGDGRLVAVDAASGQIRLQTTIAGAPAGAELDGPVMDPQTGTLYFLSLPTATTGPRLLVYDAATLDPLWYLPVPGATGLGPLTPDGHQLALYQSNGDVALFPAQRDLPIAPPAHDLTAARGATALGWSPAGPAGDVYLVTATGIDERDAQTGRVLATLPMRVDWSGSEPLLVDAQTGLIFLPGAHGQVVIARGRGAGTSASHVNADTAVVLAHSALASFLPFTNQDPPFISPDSFLLSASAAGQSLPNTNWIHYIDFQWTLGPYPGTTSAVIAGAGPGSYVVTFTIRWNETFWRAHSWACLVAPDGSVSLLSDSGDIVP